MTDDMIGSRYMHSMKHFELDDSGFYSTCRVSSALDRMNDENIADPLPRHCVVSTGTKLSISVN